MDWKLGLVPVPVADIDRAKQFYTEKLDFSEICDVMLNEKMRIVQLTPPGSECSIVLGAGVEMAPGTLQGLHLFVPEIAAARAKLAGRGVEVSPVQHFDAGVPVDGPGGEWNSFIFFSDPDGNGWAVQESPAVG